MILKKISMLLVLSSLFACVSVNSQTDSFELIQESELSEHLVESSGLSCHSGSLAYTINDSGNQPIVHEIDAQGLITRSADIGVSNQDWEAITEDEQYIYIGDVGNNHGKRKTVRIIKLEKANPIGDDTLTIRYPDYQPGSYRIHSHDFDAEALVAVDEKLWLFSKSWQSGQLRIYQIDKNQPEQSVQIEKLIDDMPGIITGADFDEKKQQFVLVGYAQSPTFFFNPFLVLMDKQFNLLRTVYLRGYGQVESVCVQENGEIWFTQEQSLSAAKLVRIRLADGSTS